MKKIYIYVLLISLLNSILFYGYKLGINVILFMIPLLCFITYILYKNDKIVNKKGLLFIIPIILLSISYMIYDNMFFKDTNAFVIVILFNLMYIYTLNPTYKIKEVGESIFNLFIEPISIIDKYWKEVKETVNESSKINDNAKNKIKSFIIVIPIVVLVLFLLNSADMIFGSMFKDIFKIFEGISIDDLIGRLIIIVALFTFIGCTLKYLLTKFDKPNSKDIDFKIDNYTIKLLLTTLNVIYVVFDFIQIRSLMLHNVGNINYAEYARSGFFELMFISIINLVIILLSKYSKEDTKYNKVSCITMIFLTFIIIVSSFMRMYMYEMAYGYTLLRLLVYVSLITEVILLIPTIAYIIKPNTNIFKYYMIIIISIYTLVALMPIDYIIAKRNINKYYVDKKIDIEYLENYSSDNLGLLVDLYNKTKDDKIRNSIGEYINNFKDMWKSKGFQDYNISRSKVNKILKNKIAK